ncbi:MAG: DNA polymerase III subunit alpha, partial [Turicibacter sp.]
STEGATEDNGIAVELIYEHVNDLIVITDGEKSYVDKLLKQGNKEHANQYFNTYLKGLPTIYIGLLRVDAESTASSMRLLEFADTFGIGVVALNDVRYLYQEDAKTLTFLRLIDANGVVGEHEEVNNERYYKTEALMKELFHDVQGAVDQISMITAKCDLKIELNQVLLPKYTTPEEALAQEYLKALCYKGLKKRYSTQLSQLHVDRLEYELSVIDKMGFSDYFLIVWDFVKFAKLQGIYVGCGRGSAAGSLVSYVLGITNVDPIQYELLFERFLNPERISMPDIDIDFQDNRRDEVIEYVQNKYGARKVVQITTFGTFQSRSAWRDLARIHEIETKLINTVAGFIYSTHSLHDNYQNNSELREFLDQYPKLRMIYQAAQKIEGLPRHTSIHAAGIIMSEHDLTRYTALMPGVSGIYLSQYEAEDLEAIGLLKMDFLGLKNLTMLQQIVDAIKLKEDPHFNINQIPFDDAKTFELIALAQTTGVFQLESEGMRQVLRAILPTHLEDIIACNALFRPGPMENIPHFAARKHGKEKVEYYHPSLTGVLNKTYGIIVYQEQIMQIANIVCGYSLGEADVLRRAVSKKKMDVLQEEEAKFISHAEGNGYSKETSKLLYDLILKFANYGFNRSHAVAYSMIAYQMAYLKTHYPSYFMIVSLTNVIGSESNTAQYVKEARMMGIQILPPSINNSYTYYAAENGNIRFSLLPIKNIGVSIVKQIITERERGRFTTFFDFVNRCRGFINLRAFECLIDAGAVDEFGYNRQTLHQNLGSILDFSKYNGGLFDVDFEIQVIKKEFPQSELMKREKDLLGFYLSAHPIKFIYEEAKQKGWYLPSDIQSLTISSVTCVGYVERLREIRDKKGNLMCFLEMSDENGSINVTIFSDTYKQEFKELLGKVITVNGRVSVRNSEKSINLSKIIAIS